MTVNTGRGYAQMKIKDVPQLERCRFYLYSYKVNYQVEPARVGKQWWFRQINPWNVTKMEYVEKDALEAFSTWQNILICLQILQKVQNLQEIVKMLNQTITILERTIELTVCTLI